MAPVASSLLFPKPFKNHVPSVRTIQLLLPGPILTRFHHANPTSTLFPSTNLSRSLGGSYLINVNTLTPYPASVPLPTYHCPGFAATMKREFAPSIRNKLCPFQHDVIVDGLIMEAVYWILCSCSCEWCTLVHGRSQTFAGLLGRSVGP